MPPYASDDRDRRIASRYRRPGPTLGEPVVSPRTARTTDPEGAMETSADLSPGELAAVHHVLAPHVTGLGPLTASLLSGGRSNLTYALSDGARRWVLRRPPLGHVLATAHDMEREYRVMRGLAPTAVLVPRTVVHHAEPDVLGAPFYVMELIEGTVYRSVEDLQRLGADEARRLAHAFVDALAELHLVDAAAVGLGDFGRPDGYLARQIRRWG